MVRGDATAGTAELVVIVPWRRGREEREVLALPKGHVDPGETPAQAATRELREEAGVEGELVERLGDVRYWYVRGGQRISKVVSFFLFAYGGGDPADHDDEVLDARWMPLEEACTGLTYPGEREMAARALSRLRPDR